MAVRPRAQILQMPRYVPGAAPPAAPGQPIKLASNEAALGPSPAALAAFAASAAELRRYPDAAAIALRTELARMHGCAAENYVCSNGSEHLIHLIIGAYAGPGDEVVFGSGAFSVGRLAALAHGARPVPVPDLPNLAWDVDALVTACNDRTRVLYLPNPNNPTGALLPAAELRSVRAALPPHVLLLLDTAYAEYIDDPHYERGLALVREGREDVVVTGTFSKAYALAAVRVGWACAHERVVDAIDRVRPAFSLSGPAQAAALAALGDTAHVAREIAHVRRWRAWLADALPGLGVEAAAQAGNFVLARFPGGAAQADALLKHLFARGVSLRPVGSYGLPDALRISIGTEEEMRTLVAMIGQFLQNSTAGRDA